MAQSKSFFGLRRGSTKSLTFQVYRGKQITKDRVEAPANPQSDAQMRQRLKLVGVANAAAQLKGLIDHSFEGVDYGYKSIAHFRKLNLAANAINITSYVPKGLTDLGRANYIISRGSLPELIAKTSSSWDENYSLRVELPGKVADEQMKAVSSTSTEIAPTEDNMKKLCQALGCEEGAQVTFLLQVFDTEKSIDVYRSNGATSIYDRSSFFIARIITDYTDENFAKGWHFPAADNQNEIINDSLPITLQMDSGGDPASLMMYRDIAVSGFGKDTTDVTAIAVIQSKKDGDVWQRSDSRLMPLNPSTSQYALWTYNMAVDSYLEGNGASNLYLNQGTESVEILPNE